MRPSHDWHEQQISLASEVLQTAGRIQLAARGYSMLPTLWPGDVLLIRKAGFDQAQPGQIALYGRDGRFFIHRIIDRVETEGQSYLIARGDAMWNEDAPVSADEWLGVVVSVEQPGRGQRTIVPACSPLTRGAGLMLGSWSRLRSAVLWLRSWWLSVSHSPAVAEIQ